MAGAVLKRQHHPLTRLRRTVAGCPDTGIGSKLIIQFGEFIIALPCDPVPQPEEQVLAPFGEIRDTRCHSVRVQRQAQYVDRLGEEGGGHVAQEDGGHADDSEFGDTPAATGEQDAPGADTGAGAGAPPENRAISQERNNATASLLRSSGWVVR